MNWKITKIKISDDPITGTIVNASFSVSDGISTIESDTNLLPANIESCISFDLTTEDLVVNWVKDALDHGLTDDSFSNVKKYESLVEEKTNSKQYINTPLPWA